jgi:hypothetical protein
VDQVRVRRAQAVALLRTVLFSAAPHPARCRELSLSRKEIVQLLRWVIPMVCGGFSAAVDHQEILGED